MSKVIGIDLGTTNSCIAFMEGNISKVIENSEGSRTTPSVVAYTSSGDILVGITAKRQAVTNPKNTLFAIKRLMGRRFSEIDLSKCSFNYDVVSHSNGDAWVRVNGKDIAPQQVSSEILKKMKKSADEFFGEDVRDVVITVPAYFNDTQRQATKDAGSIAGLNVKRIINEPTAAALAFGLNKNYGSDKKIIVYDLGGGTFDVSVIEIINVDGDKQFEVLSTNGDTFLGGEDFDARVVTYLSNEFKLSTGIDISSDVLANQRLREAAEKAKIELSTLKETDINLPYIASLNNIPKHLNIKLTRSKLDSIVLDLVDKTLDPCKLALKDASLNISDIGDVILIGGMTRMPLVQDKVRGFFNLKPKKDVNPDEAVAIGAAIQGQILSGARKDILLLDVIPLSLGIETLGGVMSVIIKKNTTIPTKHSQVFSTAEDNQSAVTIKVYQGERNFVSYNKFLGEFNLEGIKPASKGVPQIEVTFDIDTNGILNVSAMDKSTGLVNKIVIKSSSGLSKEEIESMIKDAKDNEDNDNKRKNFIDAKNTADTLVYDADKLINTVKNLNDEITNRYSSIKDSITNAVSTENVDLMRKNIDLLNVLISDIKKVSSSDSPS